MNIRNTLSKNGFTIFELIISMTVFGVIMISTFDSVANIGIARTRNVQRIGLIEELYFFGEKLVTTIKEGGTIDYEEYWARTVMGTGTASGHYITPTYFGNYGYSGTPMVGGGNDWGDYLYYCRSGSGGVSTAMGTGGCLDARHTPNPGTSYSGVYQRYGQYKLQFWDYNGDKSDDIGDEDGLGSGPSRIVGDQDDLDLGDGPNALSNPVAELYLIDILKKKRLFFRWNIKMDPDAPVGATCDTNTGIGSGCLGNIQILKMNGLDIGMNHNGVDSNNFAFDGDIDTWACDTDWRCTGKTLSGSYGKVSFGSGTDWVDLFPDYVNVKSINFSVYPLKNPWYAWKASDDISGTPGFISPFIHPYVKLEFSLGFAWKRRTIIRNDDPTISVSTSINLEDSNF